MNTVRTVDARGAPKSKPWLIPGIVVGLLLIIATLNIPVFDGPGSRQSANEASAVGKMARLSQLEARYAATFVRNGYSCEFSALHPIGTIPKDPYNDDPSSYWDRDAFLLMPAPIESVGYRFAISDCNPEAIGSVRHFVILAVPLHPGLSGTRVFCSDESGTIFYSNGSVDECLAHRTKLD